MARSPVLPPIKPLIISLSVTALVLLLFLVLASPQLVRFIENRQHLARLTAEEIDREPLERSLSFAARRADERPAFREALIDRLMDLPPQRFGRITTALDYAGVWNREHVPDDAWLRWIGRLAAAEQPAARVVAAQSLAPLTDLADHPPMHTLLETLVKDETERVRVNAVTPLGKLGGAAADPTPYARLLLELTRDDNAGIARQAWIVLGLIAGDGAAIAGSLDLGLAPRAAPPPPLLALPKAWALVRLAPQRAESELRRWLESGDAAARLAARYALEPDALAEELGADRPLIDLPADAEPSALVPWLTHRLAPIRELAAVVAVERFDAPRVAELARRLLVGLDDDGQLAGAVLAGLADVRPTAISGGMSVVLERNPDLTAERVRSMSDAELAELGLERIDVVMDHYEHAADWVEKQLYGLALWMRGDTPPGFHAETYADYVRNLLLRDDVPRTPVLLALLDAGHVDAAAAWLLNPTGEPPLELDRLLTRRGWWGVLRRYLPEHAPPLWTDAPPALRSFQYDVLRNWALVELHDPRTH